MIKKITTQELNKLIGHRIQFFRKLRGVTQIELAKALGYTSTGAVSRIERGDIGMKKSNLSTAAKVLQIQPYLLTMEENLNDEEIVIVNNFIRLIRQKTPNTTLEKIKSLIKSS